MIIGLGLAAAALAQAQTQAPAHLSFSIGSVGYDVPVPEGYCVPEGADAAAAERTNAGDVHNRTLLFIHSCQRPSGIGAQDYASFHDQRPGGRGGFAGAGAGAIEPPGPGRPR